MTGEHVLILTQDEWEQITQALGAEPRSVPELVSLIRQAREAR